jgi:hypothetical protein
MHKILTVVAVVAMVSLGTSVVAAFVLHSSVAKQSHQIGALQQAENADHKEIVALEAKVAAANKHRKLTAALLRCTPAAQPIGQPGFAFATPELLFTIRQDSLTAWKALAGMPLSSDTSASGHCG